MKLLAQQPGMIFQKEGCFAKVRKYKKKEHSMEKQNILYFDCASGISGDMVLGALLDLGGDLSALQKELEKLHIDGLKITLEDTEKNGIGAKQAHVLVDGEEADHVHEHNHECSHAQGHEHEHSHEHEYGHECEHNHGHEHAQEHGHSHAHEESMHSDTAGHADDGQAMEVHTQEHGQKHDHEHDQEHVHVHPHIHRTYADIRAMIEQSELSQDVKDLSLRIFGRVARAEAKVHKKTIDEVHFHEVGAVDSIADIVGCAILISQLQPDAVYASVLHDGHGFIHCQHGQLPVPVPATSEILAEAKAVMKQIDIEGELITPTGAAIISELTMSFGVMPEMSIEKIGWGAGTKDFGIPNVLKVYYGTNALQKGNRVSEIGMTEKDVEKTATPERKTATATVEKTVNRKENANRTAQERETNRNEKADFLHDTIAVLEANLDDCTGELLGYAMQQLMKGGALDVSFSPIFMKKNRPGYRLTVLAKPEDEQKIEKLIFQTTTTIGIRKRTETRTILERAQSKVQTPYGEIEAKEVFFDGKARIYPEYESAVKLAEQKNVSLWEIYNSYGKS